MNNSPVKLPKGWRQITEEDTGNTFEPLTMESLESYFSDMMKDLKDITFLKYCPHQEDIILFSTDPLKGCSKCIEEWSKQTM